MKRLTLLFLLASAFVSCQDAGTAEIRLDGTNNDLLPPELKGLKIYRVHYEGGSLHVGVTPNGETISTEYRSGKTQKSAILVSTNVGKREIAGEIISESDSIIVIKLTHERTN
jgi:hypothetical protein